MAEQFEYRGYSVEIKVKSWDEANGTRWICEIDICQSGKSEADRLESGHFYRSSEEARNHAIDVAKGHIDKLLQ